MTVRSASQTDALEDFTCREISLNGTSKPVLVSGSGPGVIILAQTPGVIPHVARFARWVRDAGFRVYMPSLFDCDDVMPRAKKGEQAFQHACVSAEFRAFVADKASPVTQWLHALAQLAHTECKGAGVGTIGMCFTGNFALSMMLEPAALAPILAPSSLPMDTAQNSNVLAYRFTDNTFCQAQRFAAHKDALHGDHGLPDCAANSKTPSGTKPVVTNHLVDAMNEPTIQARDEILAFFKQGLVVG